MIWGIWLFIASREKAAAVDLSVLETMATSARIAKESAMIDRRIPNLILDNACDTARNFEGILREGRVERTKAHSLAFDFVYDYREIVIIVRGEMPERREWADEMDAMLSRVEAAAQPP